MTVAEGAAAGIILVGVAWGIYKISEGAWNKTKKLLGVS